MGNSFDRLNELVRQQEAKSRAQRIHIEIRSASDQLRAAAERARRADQRLREVRPARLRELEQVDVQEQQLKDLVRKVAQMKPSLEVAESPEDLIVSAHREIEIKRREARAELDEVVSEAEEAKRELRAAMENYQQIRLDLERLQPHLVAGLAEEDRLVSEAAMYFPAGQLQALAKEVEDGVSHYGLLDSREQYAQLKIWIGRYRRLQTFPLNEDEQAMSRRIFSRLVGLSKEYEPGYIEAFQINFSCDWDQFIEEAYEQMKQAADSARRKREMERQHGDYSSRHADDTQQEQFDDLLSVTRGMRVLLIDGAAREDSRRLIERVFDLDRLDWQDCENAADVLETLEQRLRNRELDLVLILSTVGRHHVSEKLRSLCEQVGIPCLTVEHGSGPAQIGDAVRRGLLRTV